MKKDQFTIPISDIDDSDRVREEFDILELKESIDKFGVLQPIAVSVLPNGKFKLLDGGRRVKACLELGQKEISVFILTGDYDSLTKKEIELEANIQRKDFSFVERNRLVEQIHSLMQAKHGAKKSTAADAEGWSMDDTAKKLGKSRAFVSNALEMGEALKLMPGLADSKNESEARKTFKQAEKGLIRELTLTAARDKRDLSPIDQRRLSIEDTYIIGDAEMEAAKLPTASQHLVEIDWPFSIELEDHMGEYVDIKKEDYLPFMQRILAEAKRILRSDGWLIVWYAAHPWAEPTFLEIQKLGLRTRRIPLYWEKTQGETKRPEYYLSTNQETAYYAGGLDATIVRRGASNRFSQSPVPSQYKIHRTQKPVTLYEDIFSVFCMPGEGIEATVMFAGSGNALLALDNLCVTCRGFDLKQEYKDFFCMNVHNGTPGEYVGWEV